MIKTLKELGLNENTPPNAQEWKILLSRFHDILTEFHDKQTETEKMADLSFTEVQKLWDLVMQKELTSKAIFNSTEDLIIVLDSSGQIIDYNATCLKLLKVSDSEILGKKIQHIVKGGTFIEQIIELFDQKNESILDVIHNATLLTADHEEIHIQSKITKVMVFEVNVYPIYIKDLTQIKESEKALEENRVQLLNSSKMSALGEMAGGIAHEINTPLAAIQMRTDQITELLDEHPLNRDSIKSALSGIEQTIHRISKIINSLRTFSRDGRNDAMSSSLMTQIILDTFSLCFEKFNNHGISLSYDCDDNYALDCRASEISQILLNLLNNSFDAICDQSEKWVKIDVTKNDDFLFVSVTDSGSGIPMEIQEKMMQPFFTTKDIGKGTGLGLSISTGLVKKHKGVLQIDNECPNTRIVLTLPIRQKT